MKRRKVCAQGHVFFKSSDCPTCPRCEAARRPAEGFLSELAAPARRALQGAGVTTLALLAKRTEDEIGELHGMGPSAMIKLRASLQKAGLQWRKTRQSQRRSASRNS
jgi:predicted RecB family nuclease